MEDLVMDLVSCLVIPIGLYLIFYFVPEIGFSFYLVPGVQLAEKIFV